jgi:hypothetical protein
VIVTAHPDVDHGSLADRVPTLIDLRGVTRHVKAENVVLL